VGAAEKQDRLGEPGLLCEGVDVKNIKTFSHGVMAGIMFSFFIGVGLGVYVTVWRGEPLSVTLDYIMELAKFVALGYFAKAFGENILKIILVRGKEQRKNETDEGGNNG
jgi:hypothetical protein